MTQLCALEIHIQAALNSPIPTRPATYPWHPGLCLEFTYDYQVPRPPPLDTTVTRDTHHYIADDVLEGGVPALVQLIEKDLRSDWRGYNPETMRRTRRLSLADVTITDVRLTRFRATEGGG